MKYKLSIVVDIPDKMVVDEKDPQSAIFFARELLFDNLTNFAVKHHLRDAIGWMTTDSPNKNRHVECHRLWAKILDESLITARVEENFA